jgi:hypothetical protein
MFVENSDENNMIDALLSMNSDSVVMNDDPPQDRRFLMKRTHSSEVNSGSGSGKFVVKRPHKDSPGMNTVYRFTDNGLPQPSRKISFLYYMSRKLNPLFSFSFLSHIILTDGFPPSAFQQTFQDKQQPPTNTFFQVRNQTFFFFPLFCRNKLIFFLAFFQ